MSSYEQSTSISSLSSSDAKTLLEIIHISLSCNTENDFLRLFPRIQELFQFDYAGSILGRLDPDNGLVMTHGVNISFPREWVQGYLSQKHFNSDIATQVTFRTCKLNHWSYFTQDHLHIPREIKTLNMDFGVLESYCHGMAPPIPGNNGSMFCFAGPSMKREKRTEAILEHLTPHLHFALSHISKAMQLKMRGLVLSECEKEVLNWLKKGKSSWDISVILSISERTVNYHVYNIMGKLNASNRPQAVAIAIRLGLVNVD